MILGGVRPTLCVAFLFTYCVIAWKPNAPNQNNFPLSIFIFLSFSILLPSLFDYLFHLIVDWFPWKPEVICLLRVSLDTIKTKAGRREREKAERHRERLRKSDAMQRGIKNSFSSRCLRAFSSSVTPMLLAHPHLLGNGLQCHRLVIWPFEILDLFPDSCVMLLEL